MRLMRTAFCDSASCWTTRRSPNLSSNAVTKLLTYNGILQGTFNVGDRPTGVAFDGVNIWVANRWSNSVIKL